MKKYLLCIISLMVLMVGCTSKPVVSSGGMTLDQAIAEAAIRIDQSIEAGKKIALINFNSSSDILSSYVLDELTANIVDNKKLTVVDRQEVDLIRSEFAFQLSGEVADDSMQELGRMLGAQLIVSGSLTEIGRSYRIVIRVLNVQTATVAVQYRADITNDERVQALLVGIRTSGTVTAGLVQPQHIEGIPPVASLLVKPITEGRPRAGITSRFRQIFAAPEHAVAIRADGTLWVWGRNDKYQLGDGTTIDRNIPIRIGLASNWLSVSASGGLWVGYDRTNAIREDGTLWALSGGLLGNGTHDSSNIPIQIGTDTNWAAVSIGPSYNVAIKKDGTLWAWGWIPGESQGIVVQDYGLTLIQIGTVTNWALVSAGWNHIVAIRTDGTLWAWGANNHGQLGDGTTTHRTIPVQIGTATNWIAVSTSTTTRFTVAIRTDGTLWALGGNSSGQLGNGTKDSSSTPVQIGKDTNWASVSAGTGYALAIRTDGSLWAWGRMSGVPPSGEKDHYGIIVDYGNTPVQVGTSLNWASVSAGDFAIATRTDGTFWAWGDNRYGQLGDGTTTDRLTPVQIRVP